jgi:hypothetical protein
MSNVSERPERNDNAGFVYIAIVPIVGSYYQHIISIGLNYGSKKATVFGS